MDILSKPVYQRKMSSLQEEILRQIAKGDIDTKSSLSNILKRDYPNINDSVDILLDKGFLQIIYTIQNRGKAKKILGLTDKGILKLIDLGISSQDFWKMLFFVYDTSTKHKLELSIDEVFSEYEKKVLLSSSKNIPYLTSSMSNGFFVYEFPEITIGSIEDKILELLIYQGSMTSEQIFKKLKIAKNEHIKYLAAIGKRQGNESSGLIGNALVVTDKSETPIYRATLFAVLLELSDLYALRRHLNIKHEEIESKIKSVMEQNKDLLPLVFGKWNKLKRFWNEKELFDAFIMWFSKTGGSSAPILTGGLHELFELQYCWGLSVGNKYMLESSMGESAHNEWLQKRGLLEEKLLGPDFKVLVPKKDADSGPVLSVLEKSYQLHYLQPYEENVDQYGLDEDSTSEKALANTMSFRFYTHLLSYEWDTKDANLVPIFEKDAELRLWYYGWMHEFNRYLKDVLDKTEKIENALRV